jgi:phage repressor protein C with HTH and peptisase S24 domain
MSTTPTYRNHSQQTSLMGFRNRTPNLSGSDRRDDLRAHSESMEPTIETGDVSDPTVVSEVTVARVEREDQ